MDDPSSAMGFNGTATVLTLSLGSAIAVSEPAVVSSNIPVIREGLNLSLDLTGLVSVGSSLALAATILGAGALGEKLGMRKMFLAGAGGAVVFGFLSAAATNGWSLVAARVGAGVSFAFLLCLSLSIIRESFPADRVARAIALFVGAGTAFAIVPPIVGSELMNRFGWRAGLLVAPVLAAALIALVFRYVPETPCYDRPLDVPAMLLSAVGLIGLLYGISSLRGGVHAGGLVSMAVGVVAVAAFWWWEKRTDTPALDPVIFRSRGLVAATVAGAAYAFVSGGSAVILANYMIIVRGSASTLLHVLYIPATLLAAVTAIAAGRVAARLGESTVLIGGLVLLTAAVAFRLVFTTNTPMLVLAVVMAIGAMCGSVVQTALTTVFMLDSSQSLAGVVSALRSNVQATAYAFGGAIFPLLGIALFQYVGGQELSRLLSRDTLRMAHLHGASRGIVNATDLDPQGAERVMSVAESIWMEVGTILSLLMSIVVLAAAVFVFATLRPGFTVGRRRSGTDESAR